MRRSIFLPLVLIYIVTVFGTASAQVTIVEKQDNKHPTVYKMTVSPAAEPQPALKYRFLVSPVDQIHANAATLYYKAMSFEGTDPLIALNKAMSDDQTWEKFFAGPLDRFPQSQAEQLVQWLNGEYFEWIREAAHCDYCDWADGIRQHGVATLLPQAQNSRTVCRALAIRARLQITQQKFGDAIETLAAGYGWSRALGHGTTLIQCLIGMGFQGLLDEQTVTLIAADDSPNLYWALTDLAVRPIEFRQALSYESKMWEFTVHGITQLNERPLSPEEAIKLAKEIPNITDRFGFQNVAQIFLWAATLEPEARKYLLSHGYTTDKLDSMPVLQVVLLYRWKQFEIVRANCFKFLELPDDELRDAIDRADDLVRTATARDEGTPFTQLLPAISAINKNRLRSIQQIDMLRVVEALRMYAAEHGRWPEKLDDIKSVPIPNDPYTVKPFEYSLVEGTAKLSAPPNYRGGQYTGGSGEQRYELTLRPSKSQ
jgi:hypothetical protein